MSIKKKKNHSSKYGWMLIIMLALTIAMVTSSCKPNASSSSRQRELEALQREREEFEAKRRKAEAEARLKAEAEARERAREREDAEEKKRREEQEAKSLELERQRQEMREKAEAERKNKENYRNLMADFRNATCVFGSDVKKKIGMFGEDGTIYFIREDYLADKKLYKFECQGGKIKAAYCITEREGQNQISETDVKSVTDSKRCIVLRTDGIAEIWGTGKLTREMEIPENDSIFPLEGELLGLYETFQELGMKTPKFRYRISLKNTKTSDKIRIGIIEADEKITESQINEAIEGKIAEKRAKKVKDIKPPKLKKFKPSAVLYDGKYIKKEIGGVTKVPRVFEHIGTTGGGVKFRTVEYNRARWKELYDEALRQEKKARMIKEENERIMDEYKQKLSNFTSRSITQEEREAELSKYVILIERSLTKLKLK